MRRTIISLSLLAAAAICIVAMAGSAGAATLAPRIICPVYPHIVPCCPLPPKPQSADAQPICCQTTCCTAAAPICCQNTTCCPSTGCCTPTPCATGSLTIASAPNPSIAGRRVVISGTLVGNAASGAQVVLWGKQAGQSSFRQVAQTTTEAAGRYTFTLARGKVMTDQTWYVAANGVHSATLQQHVGAIVALSSSTHTVTVGQAVRLRGDVTPSHARETVLIEQSRAGSWRIIAAARLGKRSTYAISHRFSQRGRVRLRAVLRGDLRNDRSSSPSLALTVKP